jgi:hypothetical protein
MSRRAASAASSRRADDQSPCRPPSHSPSRRPAGDTRGHRGLADVGNTSSHAADRNRKELFPIESKDTSMDQEWGAPAAVAPSALTFGRKDA